VEKLNTMDHKMDSNIMLVENIKQKLDEGDKLIDRLVDYKLTEQRLEMKDHMKREYIQAHNVRSSGIYEG